MTTDVYNLQPANYKCLVEVNNERNIITFWRKCVCIYIYIFSGWPMEDFPLGFFHIGAKNGLDPSTFSSGEHILWIWYSQLSTTKAEKLFIPKINMGYLSFISSTPLFFSFRKLRWKLDYQMYIHEIICIRLSKFLSTCMLLLKIFCKSCNDSWGVAYIFVIK